MTDRAAHIEAVIAADPWLQRGGRPGGFRAVIEAAWRREQFSSVRERIQTAHGLSSYEMDQIRTVARVQELLPRCVADTLDPAEVRERISDPEVTTHTLIRAYGIGYNGLRAWASKHGIDLPDGRGWRSKPTQTEKKPKAAATSPKVTPKEARARQMLAAGGRPLTIARALGLPVEKVQAMQGGAG